MENPICIVRVGEPRGESFYMEFFEFEGTLFDLLITLIDLDRELVEQKVLSRGFILFPKDVCEKIMMRYISEDENLRKASIEIVSGYYPGFTDKEVNKLLGTTEYIVAAVKRYCGSKGCIHEIVLAYQDTLITLVYYKDDIIHGHLELAKVSPEYIEYVLKVYGGIKKKDREREATFEALIDFIRNLGQRQYAEKSRQYIKL